MGMTRLLTWISRDRDASNSQSTIRALRSNTRLAIAESSRSSPVLDPDELWVTYARIYRGFISNFGCSESWSTHQLAPVRSISQEAI